MTDDDTTPRTRWAEIVGDDCGPGYAEQTRTNEAEALARGDNPYGEADLVVSYLPPGGRVLDAGCGTGRVAHRLHEQGVAVVGVDADLSMLREAADADPQVAYWLSDLAELDLPQALIGRGFDVVVLAGNVVPLVAPGTLDAVMVNLAGVLAPEGVVVAGFGLDRRHLPGSFEPTTVEDYDRACAAAGLDPVDRFGTWERGEFTGTEYVVAVHRRRPPAAKRSGLRSLLRR